ncbi:metallophosphoesterase, partial [Enterococcus faecalis]
MLNTFVLNYFSDFKEEIMNVYLFLALFFITIGILSYSFFIVPKCLVIQKNQIKVTESGKT